MLGSVSITRSSFIVEEANFSAIISHLITTLLNYEGKVPCLVFWARQLRICLQLADESFDETQKHLPDEYHVINHRQSTLHLTAADFINFPRSKHPLMSNAARLEEILVPTVVNYESELTNISHKNNRKSDRIRACA